MPSFVRRVVIPGALLGVLVCAPIAAFAHKLNVFAYVEGSNLVVEAYFADGKAAKGAVVEAYAADDTRVAESETDEKGTCRFPVPDVEGDLRLVAKTGDGHRAEYTVLAGELSGASTQPSEEPSTANSASGVETDESRKPTLRAISEIEELRIRLDRVEASLHSLQRQVAELRRPPAGPSPERVLAGLAFIIALTGVAMYVAAARAARKARSSTSEETGD